MRQGLAVMTLQQIIQQIKRLPYFEQVIIREHLEAARVRSLVIKDKSIEEGIEPPLNETIAELFYSKCKEEELSYKARRVMLHIYGFSGIRTVADIALEGHKIEIAKNKEVRKFNAKLQKIHDDIEKYFKSRGWIYQIVNKSPFFIKTLHKPDRVSKTFILHGLEEDTGKYVLVRTDYDKQTGEQIGDDDVSHFATFKELKGGIK